MQLFGSTKSKIIKNENGENVSNVHCNIVNNNYHQNSRVLHTFVPNKSFGLFFNKVAGPGLQIY